MSPPLLGPPYSSLTLDAQAQFLREYKLVVVGGGGQYRLFISRPVPPTLTTHSFLSQASASPRSRSSLFSLTLYVSPSQQKSPLRRSDRAFLFQVDEYVWAGSISIPSPALPPTRSFFYRFTHAQMFCLLVSDMTQ